MRKQSYVSLSSSRNKPSAKQIGKEGMEATRTVTRAFGHGLNREQQTKKETDAMKKVFEESNFKDASSGKISGKQ